MKQEDEEDERLFLLLLLFVLEGEEGAAFPSPPPPPLDFFSVITSKHRKTKLAILLRMAGFLCVDMGKKDWRTRLLSGVYMMIAFKADSAASTKKPLVSQERFTRLGIMLPSSLSMSC